VTDWLGAFERIVRTSAALEGPAPAEPPTDEQHPFETRNIHRDLPARVRELFDDGYLHQSVFAAFTFVEKEVKRMSGVRGKTGEQLMGAAFGHQPPALPIVALNALATDSELDEQRGYQHLFKGAVAGIRNPRGHEVYIPDTPDRALDYLALASLLLRKLDEAGRSGE